MPFSALVQKHFSLVALNKARGMVSIRPTCIGTANSIKKRYIQATSKSEKSSATSHLRVRAANVPAWASHLESFRHRSHYSTTASPQPLFLLGSAKRSAINQQLAHEFAGRNGMSMVQVRRCKTSAQYISDIEGLVKGNQTFRNNTLTAHPKFFEESAKGQSV